MKLIELHILQSFPVSCLNRDDMGTPKTAIFGGCKRARISSQCLKRAQRTLFREYVPEFSKGERTKFLVHAFCRMIEKRADAGSMPENLPVVLSDAWGKVDTTKKKDGRNMLKLTTLTYLSPAEMSAMIDAAVELLKGKPNAEASDIKKAAQNAVKGALVKDAADIALYGRMLAGDASSLSLEGAAMFSHAISTHKAEPELDFYAAVDDLQPLEETGAGMTGMLEFSSACYYRYVAVNVDLLKQHLNGLTEEQINEILSAFVKSTVFAVPSARKNSMNASTVPSYVLGMVRNGHPLQLVNAFESPVRPVGGYTVPSVEVIKKEYAKMKDIWGVSAIAEAEMPDLSLNVFIENLIHGLA